MIITAKMIDETVLDNPVWFSLQEKHANYCMDYDQVKFYNADYAPFGAFINNKDTTLAIEEFSKLSNHFFIVGNEPKLPDSLKPAIKHTGYQMILRQQKEYPIKDEIVQLNQTHYQDLMALVTLAYPAFFRTKTNTLGRYYGIYKNKKLVAIAGERMQTEYFTEISGVITHPEHTGNGYAKQLVTHVASNIFKAEKTPFLHVDETNTNPINLYKNLGFTIRRKLDFWKICVSN